MSRMYKALFVTLVWAGLASAVSAQGVGSALSNVNGVTPFVTGLNGPSIVGAAAAATGSSGSTTTTSTVGTTGG